MKQLALLETISKNESVTQELTQQNGILEKISTQLNTGILKDDDLKLSANSREKGSDPLPLSAQ